MPALPTSPDRQFLAAVVAARTSTEATLLVVPSDKDVEQLTSDARFFYGALEGASETAIAQENRIDLAGRLPAPPAGK